MATEATGLPIQLQGLQSLTVGEEADLAQALQAPEEPEAVGPLEAQERTVPQTQAEGQVGATCSPRALAQLVGQAL